MQLLTPSLSPRQTLSSVHRRCENFIILIHFNNPPLIRQEGVSNHAPINAGLPSLYWGTAYVENTFINTTIISFYLLPLIFFFPFPFFGNAPH
jgi:hypothetical protein